MVLNSLFLSTEIDVIGIVEIIIIVFSLILFGLAISAYRRTKLRKLLFAAIAFALFAIELLIEYADEAFGFFEEEQVDLLATGIILSILIMFFLSVTRRK